MWSCSGTMKEDEFFTDGRAAELVLKQLTRRGVYVLEELIVRNSKRAQAIKDAAEQLHDAGQITAFQVAMRPLRGSKPTIIRFMIIMRPGVVSLSAEFQKAVRRRAAAR